MFARTAELRLCVVLFLGAVALAGCTQKPETPKKEITLERNKWLIVEINRTPILLRADEMQPYLFFNIKGRAVNGFAGCNKFQGDCDIDGSSMKFGGTIATKMSCPERDKLESEMMETLKKVASYTIKGNELHLLGADGGTLVKAFTKIK